MAASPLIFYLSVFTKMTRSFLLIGDTIAHTPLPCIRMHVKNKLLVVMTKRRQIIFALLRRYAIWHASAVSWLSMSGMFLCPMSIGLRPRWWTTKPSHVMSEMPALPFVLVSAALICEIKYGDKRLVKWSGWHIGRYRISSARDIWCRCTGSYIVLVNSTYDEQDECHSDEMLYL